MDSFINIMAIVLVVAYIIFSIVIIFKMNTVKKSVLSGTGLAIGGVIIAFFIEAIATFICWAVVIGIILVIIGAIFGG